MLVNIDMDERFPDFFLAKEDGVSVEIDELTVRRWHNTFHAYHKVQQEMRAAYNLAKGIDRDH